ncbi:hypothetical protein U1Q18_036345 [Sarracenia purpurea var. burkii]
MTSCSMTAAFLGGAALSDRSRATIPHRRLAITNSSSAKGNAGERVMKTGHECKEDERESGRRRDLVFAAAAAAVCSVAGVAAAVEPKRGTPEAKKIYAPVCVTMPTARICHK